MANLIKLMDTPISLQALVEYIEALPADNTPTTSKSNQPQNPLLMVPATLKNNPLFDEVLGYMEAYRREPDKETEAYYRELDAEVKGRARVRAIASYSQVPST